MKRKNQLKTSHHLQKRRGHWMSKAAAYRAFWIDPSMHIGLQVYPFGVNMSDDEWKVSVLRM
jgi:hypothetical protein